MTNFVYPTPREDDTKDIYHGVEVADPYRWMEDPENEDVKKFIEEQNEITVPYLKSFADRDQISTTLTNMWNYPKYSCPSRHGDKYFFYMNSGLQNQSILYVQNNLDEEPTVFLDPNTLSIDGTISLSTTYEFSENGKIFSYGLNTSGSDWFTIHFRNVETGKDYPEVLKKIKFSSISWTHDNKGIFYARYDETSKDSGTEIDNIQNQKLYYHVLGTEQEEDVCVAEFPEEPGMRIIAEVTDCGKWLILTPTIGCEHNLIYITNIEEMPEITGKLSFTPVVTILEADYFYVTNIDKRAIFRTNKDAPNYRLIFIDLTDYDETKWRNLVPDHPEDVLQWAAPVHDDKLMVCYIQDVKNILYLYSTCTGEKIYTFPLDMGTITGFSGKKQYNECFYYFTSFVNPGVIYKINLCKGDYTPEVFRQITLPGFDPSKFQTTQVFYPSKDGTQIPMYIVSKSGVRHDPSRGCLQYGYGGFNISIQPGFSLMRLVFINNFDGILAIPNIRGGGEYGEKWHNAGRLFNKQNVFDDFQYAAKYLIEHGYTSKEKLAIHGGSNGGLLVAACTNQAPELFRASICQVGVLDMLRFHKFTIGYAWTTDYGSSDEEDHFKNLYAYSPLHNVEINEDTQYPSTLLLTADHDDRVVPLHSLKFIATLQKKIGNRPQQINPLLILTETKEGHGFGIPTTKAIEKAVDILCFIGLSLGLKFQ